jgi:hypothetical protein
MVLYEPTCHISSPLLTSIILEQSCNNNYTIWNLHKHAKDKLSTIIHDPWLVWMSRFNIPTIIFWLTWLSQSKINTNKHPSYTNITRTSLLLPSYNSQSLAELSLTFDQTHHYFSVHLAIVDITPTSSLP